MAPHGSTWASCVIPTEDHLQPSPISVEEEVAILDWKLESGLPAGTEAEVQCWARN